MRVVRVEEAVGQVLAHDLTQIVPGKFKGPAFSKGHVITERDIPRLLDIGKEHIYVLALGTDDIHENEAAQRIATALAGPGLKLTEPKEGKVNLKATTRGLLKVKPTVLTEINTLENLAVATMHSNRTVEKGTTVAGTRVIPLVVPERLVAQAEQFARVAKPVLEVKPFRSYRVGLVVTGSEVFKGRIEDRFGPVVERKMAAFGSRVMQKIIVPDEKNSIIEALRQLQERGAEMLVTTGGMSVDPDDKTPGAIKDFGAELVTYGTPVLPGSMLLLAYMGEIPVVGLPGCVMYDKSTVFDLLLPRIHAGEKITRQEIVALGYGGLCLGCEKCTFPHCEFGKG